MLLLLVVFCLLSFHTNGEILGNKDFGYNRMVVAAKDLNTYSNTVGTVIDPHGNRVKSFLGHTQDELDDHRQYSLTHFLTWFGLDIANNAIYNSTTDVYLLPGVGQLFPYANGDNYMYRLVYDSDNYKVAEKMEHIMFQWGWLLQFSVAGTFPGGVRAGTTYTPGDIIGSTQLNWLDSSRKSEWPTARCRVDWKCRDVNRNWSERPSRTLRNSDNLNDQFDIQITTSMRTGVRGYLTSHVSSTRFPDGTVFQNSRNVATFGQMMTYPPISI